MSARRTLNIPLIWCLVAGLALLVATRLPLLVSGNAILDGDEAILALMARHLAEGREFALFFYGQSFGLAVFEALPVAAFFTAFGVSTTSARLAILLLWWIGWVFFVLATRRLAGPRAALVAGLLLILCPAWARWSTMARGYHVAGFFLAQIGIWQTARLDDDEPHGKPAFLLLGISSGLLLLTQAIWFLTLVPFLVLPFWKRRRWAEAVAYGFGLVSAVGIVLLASAGRLSTHWSPDFLRDPDPWQALMLLPHRVWVFFSGAYAYGMTLPAGPLTQIVASSWTVLLLYALVRLAVRVVGQPRPSANHACLAATLAVLALTPAINTRAFGYRYLLPLASLLLLSLAVDLPAVPRKRLQTLGSACLVVLAALGLGSLVEAPRYHHAVTLEPSDLSEEVALAELIHDLETEGIHHVYSLSPTFQWDLIFYSGEQIKARWFEPADRRPEYPRAVDRAFFSGRPVALIGKAAQWDGVAAFLESQGYTGSRVRVSGGRYFWIRDPGEDLLRRFGFRFNEGEASESRKG